MDADLIGPAGDRLDFHDRKIFADLQSAVTRDRKFARRILVVSFFVQIPDIAANFSRRLTELALNKSHINFFDHFLVK